MSAVQTMPQVAGNNARTAGGTGKAARDDNLAELARFFQMTGPGPTTPDGPTTPGSETPDPAPQSTAARDFLKASQRRLRQLAPRQKGDSFSKASKSDESYHHLLALQRDGFLPVSKPPKSSASKSSRASTIRDSQSLDSLVTDPKRDVENIGQPWLQDKGEVKETQEDKTNRLGSLDLSEFGQLVNLAVSSPDGEASPTYQTSFSSEPSSDSRASMKPHAQTSYDSKDSQSINQSAPSINGPTSAQSNHANRVTTPVSGRRASQIPGQEHSPAAFDANTQSTSTDAAAFMSGALKSDKSTQREVNNIPASYAANSQPAMFDAKQHVQNLPTQALKLFPDVTPPRTSSKSAMRKPDGRPQQPVVSLSTVPESRPGSTCIVPQTSNGDATSGNTAQDKSDPYLRPQSAARSSSYHSTSTEPGSSGGRSDETANSDGKNKTRPMSLPMAAAINAFPLPAPTRPLPALPAPESNSDARQSRNETSNSRVARASATPRDLRQLSHLSSRNRPVTPNAHTTAPPNPKPVAAVTEKSAPKEEKEERPAQSLQISTSQTTPALLTKTRQNRAERVRALRLRDISHRRFHPNGDKSDDVDLPHRVASPMLLQTAPHQRKQGADANKKRAAAKGFRTDENAQVVDLPDFPSSPPLQSPAANLPARPSTADPTGRCNSYSPTSMKMPLSRHGSISSPGPYRGPTRCQSSSTRTASICREMTYGEERSYDSDSPLPSSDDEALGMASTSLVHDVSLQRQGMKKRNPSKRSARHETDDYISSLSRRHQNRQTPGKSSQHSPRSHRTHRSQDGQAGPSKQSTSARDSLEDRVAQLEQQNKMLQAALMGVLNAGGNGSTEGMLSGLATSLSTSKSTPAMRRRVSSTTSNCSSMEEPILPSRPRRSHPRRPAYRKGHKRPGQNSSFSSYGSSVRRGRELEDMMEDIEYGWSSDRSSLAGERLVQ